MSDSAKTRLDQALAMRGLVSTRSQAESWIRMGKVLVDGKAVTKPGATIGPGNVLSLEATEQYVSRAGLKLASVAKVLKLNFTNKVMLDVGSSTGGFTDYAMQHGARKVFAIDVGTEQLHPSLRANPAIELHEQTDIRQVWLAGKQPKTMADVVLLSELPDLIVIDVSFISLREILPHVAQLCGPKTIIAAMVKPQFEAVNGNLKHKGVIKNDHMRRDILKDFEMWASRSFRIGDKADSDVAGAKGNRERFYVLAKI